MFHPISSSVPFLSDLRPSAPRGVGGQKGAVERHPRSIRRGGPADVACREPRGEVLVSMGLFREKIKGQPMTTALRCFKGP